MATDETTTGIDQDYIPTWVNDSTQETDILPAAPISPERNKLGRNILIGLGTAAVLAALYLGAQGIGNIIATATHAQEVITDHNATDATEAALQAQILAASKNVIGLDDPNIVGSPISVEQGGGFINEGNEIVKSQPGYADNAGQIDRILLDSGTALNHLGVSPGDTVAVVKGDTNNDGLTDYVFNEVETK